MRSATTVRAGLVAGLALAAGACVPVAQVNAPSTATETPLARVLPAEADLVCVHDPSPGWMFDSLSFADLNRSLDYSALKRACPKFHGQGLGGIWVDSYRTLVVSLKNCRVIEVSRVSAAGRDVDGAPEDFCTSPDRLAVTARTSRSPAVIVDIEKRPHDSRTSPR